MPAHKTKAALTEPILLLAVRNSPEGARTGRTNLKLDLHRALAVKTNGQVYLRIAEQRISTRGIQLSRRHLSTMRH